MTWDFETVKNRNLIEKSTNIKDTIEGILSCLKG